MPPCAPHEIMPAVITFTLCDDIRERLERGETPAALLLLDSFWGGSADCPLAGALSCTSLARASLRVQRRAVGRPGPAGQLNLNTAVRKLGERRSPRTVCLRSPFRPLRLI